MTDDTKLKDNEFYNPYYFIPLEGEHSEKYALKRSDKNEKGEQKFNYHAHDKYYEGKKSGRICCTLETVTPCVFGGKQTPSKKKENANKKEEYEPAIIENFELNGKLAIPATSLKGMLSSIVEVASGSALRVLENEKYSVRADTDMALKKIGQVIKKGEQLYIAPFKFCIKLAESNDKIRKDFPERLITKITKDTGQAFSYTQKYYFKYAEKDFDWQDVLNPYKQNLNKTQKILVKDINNVTFSLKECNDNIACYIRMIETLERGLPKSVFRPPNGKKEEFNKVIYLLSNPDIDHALSIKDSAKDNYRYIADSITEKSVKKLQGKDKSKQLSLKEIEKISPLHPLGRNRDEHYQLTLKENDIVFYDDDNNSVTEISFSAIWRKPVPDLAGNIADTHDFFKSIDKEFLPMNPNRTTITPAELLFGFTSDETEDKKIEAFKGKVRVSFGRLKDGQENIELPQVLLKILDSPKPPSPNMYFTQRVYKLNDSTKEPTFKEQIEILQKYTFKGNIIDIIDANLIDVVNEEINLRNLLEAHIQKISERVQGNISTFLDIILNECRDEKLKDKLLQFIKYTSKHENKSEKLNQEPISKGSLKLSDHKPQGVKAYLNHDIGNSVPWKTNPDLSPQKKIDDAKKREKQKSYVNPITEGTRFEFHLDFDNLDDWEISLLLYALEPNKENPNKDFFHKLGLGKPLGLGSVKIDVNCVQEIKRQERYKIDTLDVGAKPNERYTELKKSDFKSFKPTENIENALDALGQTYPTNDISYPLANNQAQETEGFQWFVNNDDTKQNNRQNLKPISEKNKIQRLTENEKPK